MDPSIPLRARVNKAAASEASAHVNTPPRPPSPAQRRPLLLQTPCRGNHRTCTGPRPQNPYRIAVSRLALPPSSFPLLQSPAHRQIFIRNRFLPNPALLRLPTAKQKRKREQEARGAFQPGFFLIFPFYFVFLGSKARGTSSFVFLSFSRNGRSLKKNRPLCA